MDKKTPLYEAHLKANAKMVSYAGYSMPVQYKTGLINEHLSVRNSVGLFDVSHMGQIVIKGRDPNKKDALENLQYILSNDFKSMKINQARYSLMCYEDGTTVDDLLVYKTDDDEYLLIVNAANHIKDLQWIKSHTSKDVIVDDISDEKGLIAIQGPNAEKTLLKLIDKTSLPEKNYTFLDNIKFKDYEVMISRTGYTGEDGFEIMSNHYDTNSIWDALLDAGEEFDIKPAGLGARDTLRLEAGMPLYGHELSNEINPIEAGLSFAVKMDKENFIGKSSLSKDNQRVRAGFKVLSRGIVRENCNLYDNDIIVGRTSSGTHLPYLDAAYGMAYVNKDKSQIGTILEAENRGRKIKVEIVSLPFYKRK